MDTKVEVKTLKRSAETFQTINTPNKAPKIMHVLKLIHVTKYALNKSQTKFIAIGIDVENWIPMLQIIGSNGITIPLSCEDWEMLTNDVNVNQIKNFFKNGGLDPMENADSGFKVTGQLYNKNYVIQLKKNDFYICVAEITMIRLLEILPLINLYIGEIAGFHLKEFYHEVLYGCIEVGGDVFLNFYGMAKSLSYHQGINLICLIELLYMFPEVIKQNLNELMQD